MRHGAVVIGPVRGSTSRAIGAGLVDTAIRSNGAVGNVGSVIQCRGIEGIPWAEGQCGSGSGKNDEVAHGGDWFWRREPHASEVFKYKDLKTDSS